MARKKKNTEQAINTPSTIGDDVARAHASGDPSSYASSYRFDINENQIVHTDAAIQELPPVFRNIQFHNNNGQLEAFVPSLASGVYGLPTTMLDPLTFDNSLMDQTGYNAWAYQYDYFGRWDSIVNNNDYKFELRKAVKYWKTDPLVYCCVSMLAKLANSPVTIECKNEQVKEVIDMWFQSAVSFNFRRAFFLEYFRTGMVPVLKTLIPYVPRNYKYDKIPVTSDDGNIERDSIRAIAEADQARIAFSEELAKESAQAFAEYKKAYDDFSQAKFQFEEHGLGSQERLNILAEKVTEKQYKWMKGSIPGAYTILDPMVVEIKGPHEMAWLREPYMQITGELQKSVMYPTPGQEKVLAQLPVEVVSQIKAGNLWVWLSPNICSIVTGDKQPYERYPTPMCAHAFKALDMKEDLYQMDRSTVKGIKNRILKVTIGNDTFPAFDKQQMVEVARVFNNPSRNMTIFWNHTLEVEFIEPNTDSLKDQGKYEHWNNEIRTAFGMTKVLTGTAESAGSNTAINLLGVKERIKEAHRVFTQFLLEEIKMLKAALSISADVAVKFDENQLDDPIEMMAILKDWVMNGLIDHQTAIETMKYHFPTIVDRLKKIQKMQTDDGIFLAQPSANNLGPGGGVLTGSGGKPAKAPLAKNNSNKKGKSQLKTKAKAKLMPISDDDVAVVVNMDDLDQEMKDQLANAFGRPPEMVMTAATYRKMYGDVDFLPELPQLSIGETVNVMKEGAKQVEHLSIDYENALADLRKHGDGPKRGPLSQVMKDEVHQRCVAKLVSDFTPKSLQDNDKESYEKLRQQAMASLKSEQPDLSADEVTVYGTMICAKRWEKYASK